MNNLVQNREADLLPDEVEMVNNYLADLFVVRGKLDIFIMGDDEQQLPYEELKDYVSDEMELLTDRLKRNGNDPVGSSEGVFQRSAIEVNKSFLWEDLNILATDLRDKDLDLLNDAVEVYEIYSERLRTLEV
ncbi:hypothetical protein N780_03830 [Pontibacillus chungwhensis BH030062]|uniref:Uncharacterized protein n=1 Tax=Pontibacillus chungwhensis BH030062 TaxID=1385513 RepID=A0A0A2URT2_9BACI|nr:hypothetical protein [Pontibacillus chungwhensis]KGP90649.1 hypothetical protein N780_03830 [Pontibacillus chungwhensis BH030062]